MRSYPEEILPNVDFLSQMDVDALAKEVEMACVVRSVAERPQIDDVLGVKVWVNDGILQTEDVLDMSSYLLGAKYQNSYLPFMDKSGKDWNRESVEELKEALADNNNWVYVDTKPTFPLMLKLSKLHLQSFPYLRSFDKVSLKTEFDAKYKIQEFYQKSGKEWEYHFLVKFQHTPSLLNYWHFEMKLSPSLDVFFQRKDKSKGWMKNIVKNFVEKFLINAIVEDEEEVAKVSESYYLKKA